MRALFSFLVAAGLALSAFAEDAAPAEDSGRAIPAVTLATARIAEMQARVPVSGTLVARQPVQIFPQVSGYEITEILVEAGDTVEKGAVLARLDSETLSALLAQAEAEYQRAEAGVSQAQSAIDATAAALTQAETSLRRMRQLRESGNVSQAVLDEAVAAEAAARAEAASAADGVGVARAALALAEASRRVARLNMQRAEIVAPVAGLVSARNAELGALSGAGSEPLFSLIAEGSVELAAEVIETALPGLAVGAPAEISVAGLGRIEGEVRLVPATVDPVTRLGLARIALDPDPRLRTGLFASGWVITARRQSVAIPAGAVLSDSGGDRVQVVEDGVVRTREVRAGLLWDGQREILEGVEEGETVIARSGAFFREGDRVREAAAAQQAPEQAADP
ncbi:efflux RND transporter periplasmic adaptor subunit [Paracoccus siganidrum]|uniref:Efflux RND transporter periplasmic adaptor subunit n=1 Tax=Paracoccus siganidrum TaxID=1276757 RepID=A0A419A8S7_9RHOB|nr:efflux RND transporter periplasmic adaptor subunit [Paracoccus siganidrum]RJL18327.1 efflux RND transporter periplasmic adaptor subunit [Paracoccus siganidrum]RMC31541.1 efflux RND transporter periplasmic adaptor subunit [Paracoccus siganidrum]